MFFCGYNWELSAYLGCCILKLVECIKFWVRLSTIQYCQITHTSHAHIEPSGGPHYCSYIHGGEEEAMRRYLQPLEWRTSSFNKRTGVNVWFEIGQMDAQFSVFWCNAMVMKHSYLATETHTKRYKSSSLFEIFWRQWIVEQKTSHFK